MTRRSSRGVMHEADAGRPPTACRWCGCSALLGVARRHARVWSRSDAARCWRPRPKRASPVGFYGGTAETIGAIAGRGRAASFPRCG